MIDYNINILSTFYRLSAFYTLIPYSSFYSTSYPLFISTYDNICLLVSKLVRLLWLLLLMLLELELMLLLLFELEKELSCELLKSMRLILFALSFGVMCVIGGNIAIVLDNLIRLRRLVGSDTLLFCINISFRLVRNVWSSGSIFTISSSLFAVRYKTNKWDNIKIGDGKKRCKK